MKTNRTGKIARLPLVVREELNRRIEDGWSGRRVVRWLNGLPEVRGILAMEFEGRVIAEQNLSAWKQGGYREWVKRKEAMELARRMGEDLEEVGKGSKRTALETLALWTVAQLGVTTRQVRMAEGREKWKMMRNLVADVCKLRGMEQAGRRVELQERRMELEEMKFGMRSAECGMEMSLGSPPRRQNAKGEMEGGSGERSGLGGLGMAEEWRENRDDGMLLSGMETGSQVTGAEWDQGKSRQIQGEEEVVLEGDGGMGWPVETSAVIKVNQGGSSLINGDAGERSPRRHEDTKGEEGSETEGNFDRSECPTKLQAARLLEAWGRLDRLADYEAVKANQGGSSGRWLRGNRAKARATLPAAFAPFRKRRGSDALQGRWRVVEGWRGGELRGAGRSGWGTTGACGPVARGGVKSDDIPPKKFSPPQPSGCEGLMFPPEQSSKYVRSMRRGADACNFFF